jgi:TRAP-type C4-dicarboxylate transport system substrate-binding protein
MRSLKLLLVLPFGLFTFQQAEAAGKPTKPEFVIHWRAAHNLNRPETAGRIEAFGASLLAASGGRLMVKEQLPRLTDKQICQHRQSAMTASLDRVFRGEAEMTQVYTFELGRFANDVHVLELPYLFRNHQHSLAVLDGDVGKELAAKLFAGSNGKVRSLGFTYSGGFKQLMSTKELSTPADLKALKMGEPPHWTDAMWFDHLGISFGAGPVQSCDSIVAGFFKSKRINSLTLEFNRLRGTWENEMQALGIKAVHETNHSLLVSSLVVNEAFYQKLPADLQAILNKEARRFVEEERALSIRLADEMKEQLIETKLAKVVTVTPELQAHFEREAAVFVEKRKAQFGDMVDRIRSVGQLLMTQAALQE